MAIHTTKKTKFNPVRTEGTVRHLITGQTLDNTNFSLWQPHGSYINKHNISTARPVDDDTTGSNWAVVYFRHWYVNNNSTIGGGIVINDLLPTESEMIITGYFYRGMTPTEADRSAIDSNPAGVYVDQYNTHLSALFEVVYETDASKFSEFSTSVNGKYNMQYTKDQEEPHDSYDVTYGSKWTHHVGRGPLPMYNGHNVGVKGGWEYSSGRSDTSFAQAVGIDGTEVQTNSQLYSSNFDKLGNGLTRFFRLIVVNKSGSDVKLKLIFRGGMTNEPFINNGTYYGVYDFRTQIVSYSTDFVGITSNQPWDTIYTTDPKRRPVLGTSSTGLVDCDYYGGRALTSFENFGIPQSPIPNSLATNSLHDGAVFEKATSTNFLTAKGAVDLSTSYIVQIPINIRLYGSTGTWALPITGLEPWVTRVSDGIPVGGNGDFGDGGGGNYFLGPMPADGKVKQIRMVSAESTPYDSAHISVLRSSFTDSLQPGDSWDGGGGMEHAVVNMYPTYPTSGNTREKVWSNINGTFSDKDLILVTYTNNVKMGWIAGVVVIELDMSFNDSY